jgi:hypothetical protein
MVAIEWEVLNQAREKTTADGFLLDRSGRTFWIGGLSALGGFMVYVLKECGK